jgi:hypothetical protein
MPLSKEVQAEYQGIIHKFKSQSAQRGGGYNGDGGNSGLEMVSALRQLTSAAKVICLFRSAV